MQFKIQIDQLSFKIGKENDVVELEKLTPEQEAVINPLVPPTSGVRMEICEKRGDLYLMTIPRQMMFLRIFKAVAEVAREELKKSSPRVLLVSDDRPSSDKLVEYCAKVLSFGGCQIDFQTAKDDKSKEQAAKNPFYSRMGTPYASTSMTLFKELDMVVVITASHNELIWNGVKIYIERPLPISGHVMQAIAQKALKYTQIELAKKVPINYIDADTKNNEYILRLVQKIVDVSVLKGKKIIFWPYLGHAPELQDMFRRVGVDLYVVPDNIEPPNPTAYMDLPKIKELMNAQQSNLAILMDADRDRVVFLTRKSRDAEIISLTPNELYTAMHNLLAKEFHRKIINVRTIPSDPRSDESAALNIMAGVGYKHLGMVLFSALHEKMDPSKFATGIFYTEKAKKFEKITEPEQIPKLIAEKNIVGKDIIMVLWEESGGHTFNILDIKKDNDCVKITSDFPLVGDKYPAPAILILSTLLLKGYDLVASVDRNIMGTRSTIQADDAKKVKIVQTFAKMRGQTVKVEDQTYKLDTFEQVDGMIDIILMYNDSTRIYFRPSGTGPEVRIYIFGPAKTAKAQLKSIADYIQRMFP